METEYSSEKIKVVNIYSTKYLAEKLKSKMLLTHMNLKKVVSVEDTNAEKVAKEIDLVDFAMKHS